MGHAIFSLALNYRCMVSILSVSGRVSAGPGPTQIRDCLPAVVSAATSSPVFGRGVFAVFIISGQGLFLG